MLTGTNLEYTRQYNLRIVHEMIRTHGPLSRAEIARRTQLTGQTISNLVRELIAAGLVYEGERRTEERGAPSIALALNPEGAYSIGLDLSHDALTAVLLDLTGRVRQREYVPLDGPTPEQALDLMEGAVATLIGRQGLERERVWGVGAGIPGPMRRAREGRGYLVSPLALPGWENVPLEQLLHERLRLPVFLENNATAAAMGERWYGAGRRIRTFFYLFFGNGLGGGLVINGEPYEGFTGNAGEIGYLPAWLAGTGAPAADRHRHIGVLFDLRKLAELGHTEGWDVRRPEEMDRALDAGAPGAHAWLEEAADHLAGLVLAIEYLIDPQAIVFGGRLPDRVLQELMDRVTRLVPERRIGGKDDPPECLLATAGTDAAALGVATLPLYHFFMPAPQVLLKQERSPRGRFRAPGHTLRDE